MNTGSLEKVSVSRVTGSSRYLSSGSFWIIYFIHINSTYSLKLILNHSLNHIRLRESWWFWCCPDHCASSNNIPFSLFEANQKGDLGFFFVLPSLEHHAQISLSATAPVSTHMLPQFQESCRAAIECTKGLWWIYVWINECWCHSGDFLSLVH